MRTTDFDILIVPGLGGSGPDHWQSRWEAKLSTARRIEQADWLKPRLDAWTGRIVEAVGQASRPVLLVAQSLGVPAIIHSAPRLAGGQVRGAFLVTPPSEAAIHALPEIDPAFAPFPRDPLPFPSLVIASRNDAYAPYAETEELGYAWGGQILDAGEAGHLNADSGHGPWPEGLMSLAGFLRRL